MWAFCATYAALSVATQMKRAGLDKAIGDLVEIVYVNAPHPASGPIPNDVTPVFKGPYFEWWNAIQVGS